MTGINMSLLQKTIPHLICAIENYLSKLLQITWHPVYHSRQTTLFKGNEWNVGLMLPFWGKSSRQLPWAWSWNEKKHINISENSAGFYESLD